MPCALTSEVRGRRSGEAAEGTGKHNLPAVPLDRNVRDALHGEGTLVMNAAMSVAMTPRMAAATAAMSANLEILKADLAM